MMDKYHEIIGAISAVSGVAFRPASAGELRSLGQLKAPSTVLQFYERYAPEACVAGPVRLWTVEDMVVENTDGVPGICVHPHGYIVFASTYSGDAYCFDTHQVNANGEPQIVLASHEAIAEGSTAEEVARVAKVVAGSLLEFLEQFCQGDVDDACVY